MPNYLAALCGSAALVAGDLAMVACHSAQLTVISVARSQDLGFNVPLRKCATTIPKVDSLNAHYSYRH